MALVIVDNLRTHTAAGSRLVRQMLAEWPDHLRLISTPAYDPDANRIAWLWRWSRRAVTPKHQRTTFATLLEDIHVHFRALREHPDLILRQIGSPFADQESATHSMPYAAYIPWKHLGVLLPHAFHLRLPRERSQGAATDAVGSAWGSLSGPLSILPKITRRYCLPWRLPACRARQDGRTVLRDACRHPEKAPRSCIIQATRTPHTVPTAAGTATATRTPQPGKPNSTA
jgi:hypothetical protein